MEIIQTWHPALVNLAGVPRAVFVIVVLLTLAFLVTYAIKGSQVWFQLHRALRAVRRVKRDKRAPKAEEIATSFRGQPLRHLWQEYADTLHVVKTASSADGALSDIRATVPAEALFTREALVDGRLFDDFTRHVPGVLTGLGIIGTFAGLLQGLEQFDPSSSATAVAGLKPLLDGVGHAFIASGTAISCAMLVVFVSRFVVAYLYRVVANLVHAIDSLYATGAGEDYLARLVDASERNEANTAQLKDALVEDLTRLMTNLVDKQIAAHDVATRALGERIGETVSVALAEPMKRVGEAMELTARGNGDQVSGMLETLLTGFMAKLEDTFGSQMRGINEQMQRSMDTMAAVQLAMQTLLNDIRATNEQASNQLSGTLEQAMTQAAENQRVLTEQMREFIQEFRRLASDEQAKAQRAMDDAVAKVLTDIGAGMERFEQLRMSAAAHESERNEQLAAGTEQLVGGLTSQVNELLQAIADQVTRTQQNIEALSTTSQRAIAGMNEGALNMASAAHKFESAGGRLTNVFERSDDLSERMQTAAASLQAAAVAVQLGFEQYDSTRRTVDLQVASLTGLVETARKEAGVSKDLMAAIKTSVDALRSAEQESRQHLAAVNGALEKAFSEFGTALVNQVKTTIAETDRHLTQGTGHLTGVVQELATAMHRMRRA